MEPKFEAPRDISRQTPETAPDILINDSTKPTERFGVRGYETLDPASLEAATSGGPVAAPAVDPQSLTVPFPMPKSQVPSGITRAADDDIPVVANDDDLIEKEWVDKAKQIIAETRDDPYRREQEISKLQVEYIRRRYGREIGGSSDI